jgi:hypothetical protein
MINNKLLIVILLLCNIFLGQSYRIPLSSSSSSTSLIISSLLKHNKIINKSSSIILKASGVLDLGDSDDGTTASDKTDEELGKTHGYEGDFKVGDIVKVKNSIRIWSVKEHAENGFDAEGYEGVVQALALYGRKHKSLCSAITPVKVEFQPNGKGIPEGMFARKFSAHFASTELEKL